MQARSNWKGERRMPLLNFYFICSLPLPSLTQKGRSDQNEWRDDVDRRRRRGIFFCHTSIPFRSVEVTAAAALKASKIHETISRSLYSLSTSLVVSGYLNTETLFPEWNWKILENRSWSSKMELATAAAILCSRARVCVSLTYMVSQMDVERAKAITSRSRSRSRCRRRVD